MSMKEQIKSASVCGAGHAGLTYACHLASKGIRVLLSEKDHGKRRTIRLGKTPFYEPNLSRLLATTIHNGSLRLGASLREAVLKTDATFVFVGTPSRRNGGIDLTQIRDSCTQIGRALADAKGYHIVVICSTVVPGTTVKFVKPILERASGKLAGRDFGLATQPEFLREGNAVYDARHPSRIVIGQYDTRSGRALVALSRHLHDETPPPIVRTNPSTAEMIKCASNAFLATKISFINEMANMCQKSDDIDVVDVARGVGLDPRIGPHYLGAGLGFGGACLPKDLGSLIVHSRRLGYRPSLLEAVAAVNSMQPDQALRIAQKHLGKLRGRKIAVLGITYKQDTDDLRGSPALVLIERLLQAGCRVSVYDPIGIRAARGILGRRVTLASDEYDCVGRADCCFICTAWQSFKTLNLGKMAERMRTPLIVDARRIYDVNETPDSVVLRAVGLGRGT
jgi:UDPglucose 6-dehydrogenase